MPTRKTTGLTKIAKDTHAKGAALARRHAAVKALYPDAIVLHRVSNFYECYHDDAGIAARLLELTLTSRAIGPAQDMPMACVPDYVVERYIARLIAHGYRVAICDPTMETEQQSMQTKTMPEIVPHPIYARAAAAFRERAAAYPDRTGEQALPAYLETAEVARLLRERLRREFPGVKFSVRSHLYSGGSSVNVRWTGGPAERKVDQIAQQYRFSDFDGMIDMGTYIHRWLLPDGSLSFASTPGTAGSRGTLSASQAPSPHPDAVKVGGGPKYLFCQRDEG